ncbi:unnamed protein product [Debaryomyces tyrocola]|nr:unnamed protein product [Debaryomyces tyrocola]
MAGTQQQSEIIETVSSNDSDVVRDVKQDEKMQMDDVEKLSGDGIEKTKSDVNSEANLSLYKKFKIRVPRHTLYFHILLGCFFTAWWLSILIQDKHRHEWLIPTVLWGLLMVRLISWHCRILYVLFHYCQKVWYFVTDIMYTKILTTRPRRLMVGAVITIGVILLGTFVPTQTEYSRREDRAVSFFGIVVAIFGLYLTSNNRTKIQWNTVIGGVLMQFIIALFVLRTKCGYDIFNFISTLARELLGFAKDGVAFLTTTDVSQLGMFFFTVLPSVAFFVAFIHIWYYYGVVQWFIGKFAYLFFWTLRVSGAEAITAAASPFLGIGESAILIKDLVPYLTKAELHQIMCSGFSTISGAVLVGYIGLGLNPQALVSSCVMSIPASLAVSKLRYPETEVPVSNSKFNIPSHLEDEATRPKNVLQAFSNGATLGLRIAGTMMIQCMCIIGLVALCNGLLTWFGNYWNIHELTLELMLSYILYPIGFLLGTPRNEILHVTKLIGTKVIQNEFVAYNLLITESPYKEMSKRGTLIATYALCGFSNLGSLGITLGVLNTLTNNSRSRDITSSIISALFTGGIATLTSAAIAAMVIHDLDSFDIN